MRFQALIDGVHIDPKKGSVKISLIVSSHVSLDELTTLSPKDESIHVTLESAQTRLADKGVYIGLSEEKVEGIKAAEELKDKAIKRMEEEAGSGVGDPIVLDKEAAAKLKEAAKRLREEEEE